MDETDEFADAVEEFGGSNTMMSGTGLNFGRV